VFAWLFAGLAAALAVVWASGWTIARAAPSGGGPIQTSVPSAIVLEAESGTVLFEKNADQLIFPASLAKLMTVETVLDQIAIGNLSLDEEYVVSVNAWRRGGAPSGGSTMFAALHSKVKVRDLLSGVIIQSANDACIVLAEGISGNEAAFARLMNDRARELGLSKSNFTNPAGLPDPEMRVTVRELARLTQHIIRTYPEHYKIFSEREFTWNKIRQQNRNPLLALNIGADGLKTGFTRDAGYGLVGSAVQNGVRIIAVVAGAKTEKERADEAKKLLEWGFKGFDMRPLFAEGQTIAEAKLFGGAKGRVALTGKGAILLMVPKNATERITARLVYTGPVKAPVKEGQAIGQLRVWRGDLLVLEAPLQAAESVGVGNTPQRAFDAATEMVINLFRAGAKRL
jgi:D-alanyl-D-alanine carboxypeptidase (penicillin-binding protein 5/6)